jgi:hypothetical protein
MIRFNGKKDNIDQRTAFRLMVFCFDSYRDVKITLLNDLSVAPEYGFTGADSANIVIDATDDNIQILKNMYGNTKTMQRIHCDDEDGTKTIQDDSVREVV